MTKTLDDNHQDVVTALIILGGITDAMTLKKHLMEAGYKQQDAELAIQRSADGQRKPIVKVARDLRIELGDDLPARCAEILEWRRTGLYKGYLLTAYGQNAINEGRCRDNEGIRNAEDRTVKQALMRVAGERS